MTHKPEVSIIIVNYHTSSLINDCLSSIHRHTARHTCEVIIVDNATENLKEVIKEPYNLSVKLLQLPENVGFGRANNAGLKLAEGRNILFLNPDTLLINDAVSLLSEYLDNNPGVGACGGNLYDEDMRPALSFRRLFPGIIWELNELTHMILEKTMFGANSRFNNTGKPLKVSYIHGADLMIPRKVLDKVGGFSDEFFMYYEETDLCRRISKADMDIVSVPDAKIQHLEGGSFDNAAANKGRCERSEHGRATYYRRNNTRLNTFVSNLIYRIFLRLGILVTGKPNFRFRLDALHHN